MKRRRSIRIPGFDYSTAGAYFVTICTYQRECLFGEIDGGVMLSNDSRRVASECWGEIPQHFPDVGLGSFVVMPNHVHGVVKIGSRASIGAQHAAPELGAVMRSYKSAVTRTVNELRRTPRLPVWQRNYFEHVIRDAGSLVRISEYIATNPARWDRDRENPYRSGEDDFDRWLRPVVLP